MADGDEHALDRKRTPRAVLLHDEAGERVVAQKLGDGCVQHKLHVRLLRERVGQRLLAAEGIAPVDEIDLRARLAQEHGVLQGAVAAADDGDGEPGIERAVAHGAVIDAAADELLLALNAERTGLRADGEDDGLRLKRRAGGAEDGL